MNSRNKKRVYVPGVTISFRTHVKQDELVSFLNASENVNDDILNALEQFYGIKPKSPVNVPAAALDMDTILPMLRNEMERMLADRTLNVAVEEGISHEKEEIHVLQDEAVIRTVDNGQLREKGQSEDTIQLSTTKEQQAATKEIGNSTEISAEEMFAVVNGFVEFE